MRRPCSFRPTLRLVLAAHAGYYAVGGLWPLLHYRSFEAVTGPKRDAWLVKTVAAMILAVMATLLQALRRPEPPPEARLLAIGSATALGTSAAWYALRGRISKVYLLDALAEGILAAGALIARPTPERPGRAPGAE
ncbi:MAG: hypothetical protein M0R73_10010 [Dehalococcoidia bacterium]|nr:hypothetical protein [Dehalococcoidia bacterium]